MHLFQYMFYRIYRLYRKWGENNSEIPTAVIISICMTFNILSILPFCVDIKFNNWLYILPFISLTLINEKHLINSTLIDKYDSQWKHEKKSKRIIKGILIIIYIIGTIGAFIEAFDYYQGYTNWSWK